MSESFKVTSTFPVPAKRLYHAWLDSKEHAAFTGGPARIEGKVGGKFTAWDGYISGTTLELTPPSHILQSWRTTEFPPGCRDSLIEINLQDVSGGSRLTLKHTEIPDGQGEEYKKGWREFYFAPMKKYFGKNKAGKGK